VEVLRIEKEKPEWFPSIYPSLKVVSASPDFLGLTPRFGLAGETMANTI
jgi:hypothetical protein